MMKELNRNSWHFKLYKTFNTDWHYYDGVSFCKYFWSVIGLSVFLLVLTTASSLVFGSILAFLIELIFQIPLGTFGHVGEIFSSVGLGTAIAISVLTGISRRWNAPKVKKEPGLFKTWYRARKEKFCPTLNFPKSAISERSYDY